MTIARWPARVAILVAITLSLTLPHRYVYGPFWVVPTLEFAILAVLLLSARMQLVKINRILAMALIALLQAANIGSLLLLVHQLVYNAKVVTGLELLYSSIWIWLTNVIVFSLWFWELDRGGPEARRDARHPEPDFLFPQMVTPGCAIKGWTPGFVDYLYVSFTNATAFSPTDTMPLTPWAKLLMLVESIVSLSTITLAAARAVNILA